MSKFSRYYKLKFKIGSIGKVQSGTDTNGNPTYSYSFEKPTFTEELEVTYPLTLNFSVERSTFSQINTANFQILGLKKTTRNKLAKDRGDTQKYITVEFLAGYEDNISLCFSGTILECFSFKESGGTEYKTNIEAWDGGLQIYLAQSNIKLDKELNSADVINMLVSDLKTISLGGIGQDITVPTTARQKIFIGKTWDCLRNYVNQNLFIDNEKIYFFDAEQDVRQGDIETLNVDSGLLSSPRRRDTVLEVELLFEPRLVVGQKIQLESETVEYMNDTYKIIGLAHDGTISGAVGGRLTTRVSLLLGSKVFRVVAEES